MVSWKKKILQNHTRGQTGERQNGEEREEVEKIVGVGFVEAGTMLDEDDGLEYQLAKLLRCAYRLLNLVSTGDVSEANAITVYKRLSRSAFSKC